MEPRRTFGRRAPSQPPQPLAAAPAPVSQPANYSLPPDSMPPSVDDEIEAWKAARGPVVSFPWRQLSLMAGLCFGIASFVLPATVNDAMQWPLYLLAAASFYAGLSKRKVKAG